MSNKFDSLSPEQQEKAIKLFERAEAQKVKDMRYNMKQRLYVAKAKSANITVSDEEIDEALKVSGRI